MVHQRSGRRATTAHNQAGCPYLNQTGEDAVLDWASVLAGIDLTTLPADLRAELHQLQLRSAGADLSAATQ
jgi:hypothetical protein